jgi:hypothetical protein
MASLRAADPRSKKARVCFCIQQMPIFMQCVNVWHSERLLVRLAAFGSMFRRLVQKGALPNFCAIRLSMTGVPERPIGCANTSVRIADQSALCTENRIGRECVPGQRDGEEVERRASGGLAIDNVWYTSRVKRPRFFSARFAFCTVTVCAIMNPTLNTAVLKEPRGWIKVLELIFAIIALIPASIQENDCMNLKSTDFSEGQFFLAVTIIAFLAALAFIPLYCLYMETMPPAAVLGVRVLPCCVYPR